MGTTQGDKSHPGRSPLVTLQKLDDGWSSDVRGQLDRQYYGVVMPVSARHEHCAVWIQRDAEYAVSGELSVRADEDAAVAKQHGDGNLSP